MGVDSFLTELWVIFSNLKQSLVEMLPNLLGALAIILVGFLVAYLAKALVIRLVGRAHLLIPKPSLRARVKVFIEDKPVPRIVGGTLFWLLIFLFLTAAAETLALPVLSMWLSALTGFMPRILVAVLIATGGILFGAILRDIVVTGATSAGIVYGQLMGHLVRAAVVVVAVFVAVDQVGIDVSFLQSAFIVGLAALLLGAALAFGFGAKTSVGNILAAYYLQQTYQVGDEIMIGEKQGTIAEIGPVAVILESPEGRTCIPAAEFSRHSSVLLSKE
jgi:small-conductance mechanosensitive channel